MKKLENASNWKGVWTALITPFTPKARLDKKSLRNLIEQQIQNNIHGLVIGGSTGESSLLTDEEYSELLLSSYEIIAGRIPIVAGLGIGGTRDTIGRALIALKSGASGLLASPPAYIKAPARGLVQHFKEIASMGLPVCLYDVPSRSAMSLADEVIDELLSDKSINIKALKDASGKPERIRGKSQWAEQIALLSGDDESFPAFIHEGGHGIIGVATHFLANEFNAVLKNPKDLATFEKRIPFIRALYWESNPIPVKSLAHKIGLIESSTFQSPLAPMKSDLLEKLYELYKHE